jgi:MFS transporter, SP family, arabinose:H+ symporter
MNKKIIVISFVISLGGFLFGFDAGIISGVMFFVGPEFNLSEIQSGWVVSSPSFAAMVAMFFSGRLSDKYGRKKVLLIVAFLYAMSSILSALASSYESLYLARIVGGLAFGAALVIAPIYIAEISSAKNRGKLVSLQQLNIVFGFFAAFLSNYLFNKYNSLEVTFLIDTTVWRYMLGVELFPALLYFSLLFFIPESPRWLFAKKNFLKAKKVFIQIYGEVQGNKEIEVLEKNTNYKKNKVKVSFKDLLKPSLRFVFLVGIVIGILQQITGINAVYFYATSIFKQTGISTDAAFSSGVLLSTTSVAFTFVAIYLIDKIGRRPLLLIGSAGITISLFLCSYGFGQATYNLTSEQISQLEFSNSEKLSSLANKTFKNDFDFKKEVKSKIGLKTFNKNEAMILESATSVNAPLILGGILGFIACFAFSLGPVMWVLLSELYPIKYKGFIIGIIAFVNSLISSLVQLIFPWELANLGNAITFLIFAVISLIGFIALFKILPETKGKSLEDIELEFVK